MPNQGQSTNLDSGEISAGVLTQRPRRAQRLAKKRNKGRPLPSLRTFAILASFALKDCAVILVDSINKS